MRPAATPVPADARKPLAGPLESRTGHAESRPHATLKRIAAMRAPEVARCYARCRGRYGKSGNSLTAFARSSDAPPCTTARISRPNLVFVSDNPVTRRTVASTKLTAADPRRLLSTERDDARYAPNATTLSRFTALPRWCPTRR